MPRRSNLFQKIIKHVYDQMVPLGATITESAMVRERQTGREREVDIPIEHDVAGVEVRIAIEVRDRGNVDDVEWIDSMIGKYSDLPIDKRVAVSRSGFSKGAVAKARAHGIETKTLCEVLDIDWPFEFIRPGFALVERNDRVLEITCELVPPLEGPLTAQHQFVDQTGERKGTLADLVRDYYESRFLPQLSQELKSRFREIFPYLGDLDKTLIIESASSPVGLYILDKGNRHAIRRVGIQIACAFSYQKADVQHQRFEEALVSQGTLRDEQGQSVLKMASVQFPSKSEGQVFFEPVGRKRVKSNPQEGQSSQSIET